MKNNLEEIIVGKYKEQIETMIKDKIIYFLLI
jgi:hypothetical protein